MTSEEKDGLIGKDVTLDGVAARIAGRFRRFPVVWQIAAPFSKYEYSWEAIKRIVSNGGAFHS